MAVQFESVADDAMLAQDRRIDARRFVSSCLGEWAIMPNAFRAGEEALERALRDHRIPPGPSNFPFVSDLGWTEPSPSSSLELLADSW